MRISFRRRRQVRGALIGFVLGAGVLTFLLLPDNDSFSSIGPANTGHDNLACQDCHTKAKGSLLDQITANVHYTLGLRKSEVDFGHQEVTTKTCLSCHDRPNDRHPTHRFKEPRFAKARKEIAATECETCHTEHQGLRMTYTNSTFCMNCHDELDMKNDPLDKPHVTLIEEAQWQTCIQCHDYHGNHFMETATLIRDTIPLTQIIEYLEGENSPYSNYKKYSPKEKPSDILTENPKP